MFRKKRSNMRDAGRALAGASTGKSRALDEFEFVKAARMDRGEVLNGDAGTGTDHASGGAWRQVGRAKHVAHASHIHAPSHPQERISRRETEAKRDGIAGVPHLDAFRVSHHDRLDAFSIRVCFEPDKCSGRAFGIDPFRRSADRNDVTELDAGRRKLCGRARRDQTTKLIPRYRGLDLCCAGRDDDFDTGVETQHSRGRSRHHQRPGINANGVLPGAAVHRLNMSAGGTRLVSGGAPGRPLPDDNNVAVNRPSGHGISKSAALEWRQLANGRVWLNLQSAVMRDLARANVRDAVDRGEAMRAVAGEAQTPSPCGMAAIL